VHTGKVKELLFEMQHGISHIAFTHIGNTKEHTLMDQPSARIDPAFEGNSASYILQCDKLCDEANDLNNKAKGLTVETMKKGLTVE